MLLPRHALCIVYCLFPCSPAGGDMWNHQYLQATNEIVAEVQKTHVWANDGPTAEYAHNDLSACIHSACVCFRAGYSTCF